MKSIAVVAFGNIGVKPYRIRMWVAMIKALLKYWSLFTWPKITKDGYQGKIPRWKIKSHVFLKG